MSQGSAASASARASVLTLFALFVVPSGRPVATGVVVELLAALDLDEANVRRTLTRLAGSSLLASTRVGRRTVWDLTEQGRALARRRDPQIFADPDEGPWDGRWSVVSASVPDERRNDRYALRSRLAWVGFGQLRPGLWISPRTDHEAQAVEVLTELGLDDTAHTFVATAGTLTGGADLVREAWDLAGLAAGYQAFAAELTGQRPRSDRDRFVTDLRAVTGWVDLAHRDPHLPPELLPAGWPGQRAAAVFRDRHGAWNAPARDWYERVATGQGSRHRAGHDVTA